MAQYDLILTQNTHATLVEFSEKYVNIAKGGILTSIADGTPTVLAGGTDGYQLVRDDAEATGLKWAVIAAGHTQGTDTGTTAATWHLDSDGSDIELTATSSSKLDIFQSDGSTHIDLQVGDITADDITLTTGTVSTTPSGGTDIVNKDYADGLLGTADAMIFKGTVGSGGTLEVAAFNALATYEAGWTYRVITAATLRGNVCEVGDLIIAMVDRAGSGDLDADWTVVQTNTDGAVIGPASATDGYFVIWDGATGALVKDGAGAPGSMAYVDTTDYVANALFDANTILAANADNTPLALTVPASTLVGRGAAGNIDALTATEAKTLLAISTSDVSGMSSYVANALFDANTILYATTNDTPAALTVGAGAVVGRISTGAIQSVDVDTQLTPQLWRTDTAPTTMTSTGILGQIYEDGNFVYVCTATNTWKRSPLATNWA